MKKKTITSWGKNTLRIGLLSVGLIFSGWLLVSIVQLVLAAAIGATAYIMFPAFLELLMYGQTMALMQIWKGNPAYALMRNKMDMIEDADTRERAIRNLGKSINVQKQRLEDRLSDFPEEAAKFLEIIKKQENVYHHQISLLEEFRAAIGRYQRVIDKAEFFFEASVSANKSLGIINGLTGGDRVAMRQLREDVAMRRIMDEVASAQTNLDMAMRSSDIGETRAGQNAAKRIKPEPVEVIDAQPSPQFQSSGSLFSQFNKEKVK
jgi:hypothetical protein